MLKWKLYAPGKEAGKEVGLAGTFESEKDAMESMDYNIGGRLVWSDYLGDHLVARTPGNRIIYVYIYICVCVCVYIYIYIYIYIYTHTHTTYWREIGVERLLG